ncbi:hypothetical protein HNR21_004419 [Actinomadura cellulosilytica]|uniref:Uncharacterized protein n=1 Tax=Thermomonospora cellulosilytica TaxID=1411118 RepID=A0A7W3RA71_9ACTN|nr:hypothetical protein [Thermomonospora cellulosilytica]
MTSSNAAGTAPALHGSLPAAGHRSLESRW